MIELTLLAQLAGLLCHDLRSCVSMCAVLRHRRFFLFIFGLVWFYFKAHFGLDSVILI